MDKMQRLELRRFWKQWGAIITVVAAAAWTVVTAFTASSWSVYKFEREFSEGSKQFQMRLELDQQKLKNDLLQAVLSREDAQKAREEARAATEKDNAITRRLEAQKPFLEERLKTYLEAIRAAGRLTELNLSTDSDEWKENSRRFFQMRWGELEMVGDLGIRNAARLVGEQVTYFRDKPEQDRHNLRWAVECLADELRLSLESSWGLEPDKKRRTVMKQTLETMPDGCNQNRAPAVRPTGMWLPEQWFETPQQYQRAQ